MKKFLDQANETGTCDWPAHDVTCQLSRWSPKKHSLNFWPGSKYSPSNGEETSAPRGMTCDWTNAHTCSFLKDWVLCWTHKKCIRALFYLSRLLTAGYWYLELVCYLSISCQLSLVSKVCMKIMPCGFLRVCPFKRAPGALLFVPWNPNALVYPLK